MLTIFMTSAWWKKKKTAIEPVVKDELIIPQTVPPVKVVAES